MGRAVSDEDTVTKVEGATAVVRVVGALPVAFEHDNATCLSGAV